jgi:hypothetical protein
MSGTPAAASSRGADQDVAIAQSRGIPVYYSLAEIVAASASSR